MAKTDWQMGDIVQPADLNQIGQEINDAATAAANAQQTANHAKNTAESHAARHATGGEDPLTPAQIGAETPAGAQAKADAAEAAAKAASVNKIAAYQSNPGIDPNTTEEALILTGHDNRPPGGQAFYYIHTFFYSSTTGNRAQLAQGYQNNELWMRRYYNGSWTEWLRIYDATSINTLSWQKYAITADRGTSKATVSDDLNTIVETGVYSVATSAANRPISVIGTLVVLKRNATTLSQTYYALSVTEGYRNRVFHRTSNDGGATWRDWTEFWSTENLRIGSHGLLEYYSGSGWRNVGAVNMYASNEVQEQFTSTITTPVVSNSSNSATLVAKHLPKGYSGEIMIEYQIMCNSANTGVLIIIPNRAPNAASSVNNSNDSQMFNKYAYNTGRIDYRTPIGTSNVSFDNAYYLQDAFAISSANVWETKTLNLYLREPGPIYFIVRLNASSPESKQISVRNVKFKYSIG